ncbi:hypothetical protein HII36_36715 [Nonomuraea sp. NN258]|uniref:hypothetical protein n=1 Tax=Nonomuraea antri TaxID=2730852 RepID=UPI0015692526|nr:hypothetical protein [Nonomuraea antri]NRQ37339.1 hypothetical protein [Nonomuraea antri]
MKRTIAGIVVATGLAQLAAAPAQAASLADPIKALKAVWTRGKAVNVVSTSKVDHGRGVSLTVAMDGTLGYGPAGEAAADVSETTQYSGNMAALARKGSDADTVALEQTPVRIISSGHDDYISGPVVDHALPRGTTWVRYSRTGLPTSNLVVEILESDTLKTLLAHRTSYRDGVLKGTIKTDKLAKVSRRFAERYGASAKNPGTVTYAIWFSRTGLVQRLSASAVLPRKDGTLRIQSETRFADWEREITIPLPLEGDVLDRGQFGDELPREAPGTGN